MRRGLHGWLAARASHIAMPSETEREIAAQQAARRERLSAMYDTEIDVSEKRDDGEDDVDMDGGEAEYRRAGSSSDAIQREAFAETVDEDADPTQAQTTSRVISQRESEYHKRRQRVISPPRHDPFAEDGGPAEGRSFAEVMHDTDMTREEQEAGREIARRKAEEAAKAEEEPPVEAPRRRRRWDDSEPAVTDATPRRSRWDATPDSVANSDITDQAWDQTPRKPMDDLMTPTSRRSRWDETPKMAEGATPVQTPLMMGQTTPAMMMGVPMTPEQASVMRHQSDLEYRNRELTDQELDAMFPEAGYEV